MFVVFVLVDVVLFLDRVFVSGLYRLFVLFVLFLALFYLGINHYFAFAALALLVG